eukprot:5597540-Prorocentrum_lima.AAC.1
MCIRDRLCTKALRKTIAGAYTVLDIAITINIIKWGWRMRQGRCPPLAAAVTLLAPILVDCDSFLQ